jgi:SNF2 family DNA or RNA helicase
MIAKDSIEEKILDLQKSKKKLVEDIITTEKSLSKTIDIETIKEIFG